MAQKVQYKIDLASVFDRAYKNASSDVKRKLRPIINSDDVKSAVGVLAVEKIIERTEKGIDMRGASFKPYSESYKDSTIFSIYGKSTSVNLKLTGEMLASIEYKNLSKPEVVIFMSDQFNNDKAHGHMNGIPSKKYGKVKREFLGLPKNVEQEILVDAIMKHSETLLRESVASGMIDRINIEAEI